ncbi:hypothetical protein CEXT_148371 [Caerostris extrusa]|uniref:Uncharacterized protein n=1 Tax=Caerostris extrusa TaxID=172846 RepID=A0AAV4V931_CAEEX|nr:hypothetical protein CEXT_148371 [Caerostris extrusa]
MFAKVLIICAGTGSCPRLLPWDPLDTEWEKGWFAVPTISTVSSQKAVINHVAPAASCGCCSSSCYGR